MSSSLVIFNSIHGKNDQIIYNNRISLYLFLLFIFSKNFNYKQLLLQQQKLSDIGKKTT